MSRIARSQRIVIGFLGAAVVMLACAALLNDGAVRACPAIGYADISPIELEFDLSLEIKAVAACFGRDCQPVALTGVGSAWLVPQSPEYLQSTDPGSVTHVKVEASSANDILVEETFEVDQRQDRDTWSSECPGPSHYLPVTIGP